MEATAFVTMISGSTGKPKGVLCPQQAMVLGIEGRNKVAPYTRHPVLPDQGEREACSLPSDLKRMWFVAFVPLLCFLALVPFLLGFLIET